MVASKRTLRIAFLLPAIVGLVVVSIVFSGGGDTHWYDERVGRLNKVHGGERTSSTQAKNISFDLSKPPTIGCEAIVSRLQLRLIEAYSEMLRGIRYVNLWGYLETENKGDAAIWTGQQILLSMLGIMSDRSCRFLEKDCDVDAFNRSLTAHHPHSAILMAGGGNFNDYYWEDQPARLAMAKAFPEIPIRAFPQSIHMTHPDRINMTKEAFGGHKDLMLAARDHPSWKWLDENLENAVGVPSALVPDIAFMWGNRPGFRLNTLKTHDLLILARQDREVSNGNSANIKFGTGVLDLGGKIGNVTYNKVDWKFTHTPGIDKDQPAFVFKTVPSAPSPLKYANSTNLTQEELLFHKLDFGTQKQRQHASELMYNEYSPSREASMNARAWAKAIAGFELLGSAKFIVTDRLHGHIMSTIIGTPHVLLDSLLGKNLAFHNTWTQDCDCVKIAENITDALAVARMYFEQNGL